MTLILSLGNSDQFIQLSDRRLTVKKKPVTDEANKGFLLRCSNARMVAGFTGIARIGSFSIEKWILSTLQDCAPPDYAIAGILDRFLERATQDFQTLEQIRNQPRRQKRLSIMFSGYLDANDPPRAGWAILTNYQDSQSGRDSIEAWDEFKMLRLTEKRPFPEEITLVQRIGNWQVMTDHDVSSLRQLLKERKPAEAIIRKGVSMMRRMAARPKARRLIGSQVSSICLPRNLNSEITTGYHTTITSYSSFIPSIANLVSDDECYIMADIELEKVEHAGPPVALPLVHPKAPCPCGSGMKYGNCHGEKFAKEHTGSIVFDLGKRGK